MSTKLPYVNQPGSIVKIFEKVQHAQTPDRFTGDFLETKLGFKGGNYRQFIPLAKKMGFLGTDGRPSDIYKSFRNAATWRRSGVFVRSPEAILNAGTSSSASRSALGSSNAVAKNTSPSSRAPAPTARRRPSR